MRRLKKALCLGSLVAGPALFSAENQIAASQGESGPAITSKESSKVFMASQTKGNRLFAIGEVLLWRASQDDLGFAIKSSSTTTINGSMKSPEQDWDWGFRVGFGYVIPHDNWDLGMYYTHFQSQAHGHETAAAGGGLFPQWTSSATTGYATEATAHFRIHLQMADLELGRAIRVGNWLNLRPHVGVRSAWIYQKYEIEYQGGTAVPAGDIDEVNMRNNFWGIGARLGVDSLWGLGAGFSLFGDGALSLLSGFFAVTQNEHLEVAGTPLFSITSHPNNVVTILDLGLGLQYDRFFNHNKVHLGVKLGYEFNYFFDQNQFMKFFNNSISQSNGDLSFMGVTLGFRLDF